MKNLSYHDQIEQKLRKAKTAAEKLYYTQAKQCHACVSYETFSKSWAGQEWLRKNFPLGKSA